MVSIVSWLALIVAVMALHYARRARFERSDAARLADNVAAGLTEPASLHPVIDEVRCIGCASCIDACPEGRILGLVNGAAQLVDPTSCIGHGACKTACPVDAIELVFGTEKRGVDIPHLSPEFETNVEGIFIAGELGGMGLIRNAIEQGRRAIASIAARVAAGHDCDLDVVIVGAGPAGFSASLGALERKLRFVTVEQDTLGGTVAHYPRGKIVMTAPCELPLVGRVKFTETTKEELLEFWHSVQRRTGIEINHEERVEAIDRDGEGFVVKTSKGVYRTRTVLLALGRRGTPRKLGVPGEELSKVCYRLVDPEQYRGRHVLVVGGGDSALEAACSIAEIDDPGKVTLSYRSKAFSRAKLKNRQRVERLAESGALKVMLESHVRAITPHAVTIEQNGATVELINDAVIICAGGILPTPFLKNLGIEIETKYGTA